MGRELMGIARSWFLVGLCADAHKPLSAGEDTEKSMTMADVDPSATPDRNSNKLPVKTATEKSPARRALGALWAA